MILVFQAFPSVCPNLRTAMRGMQKVWQCPSQHVWRRWHGAERPSQHVQVAHYALSWEQAGLPCVPHGSACQHVWRRSFTHQPCIQVPDYLVVYLNWSFAEGLANVDQEDGTFSDPDRKGAHEPLATRGAGGRTRDGVIRASRWHIFVWILLAVQMHVCPGVAALIFVKTNACSCSHLTTFEFSVICVTWKESLSRLFKAKERVKTKKCRKRGRHKHTR